MYAGFRGSSKFVGPAAPSTQRRREESVAKSRSFGTFYRSKRVPLKHRAKQGKSFMLYLQRFVMSHDFTAALPDKSGASGRD